jgi:CYTH domain-containing protein
MSHQRIGKYACLEIERRYLLLRVPAGLTASPSRRITDHYLLPTRLRLRRVEDAGAVIFKLGQKFRGGGQGACETTITNLVLDEREYDLLRRLGGRAVVKDRYDYGWSGRRYGVDVFHGELAGLILAEVECETPEEAADLPLPDFAVADVTDDLDFTGGHLATVTGAAVALLLRGRLGST